MVNSKKNTKSIIALVVLSILLIASICLAATGAWFTDAKSNSAVEVKFGTVNISTSTGAVSVTKDDAVVMPGDTIKVTGNIVNSGTAKIWVRYKLTHNYTAGNADLKSALDTAFTGKYVYVESAVAAKGNTSIAGDTEIATTLGNTAQDASFSITLVMEAVQWANNNSSLTCEQAFEAAGLASSAASARS